MSALSSKAEDHRKFAYAPVARDIRRLTALIHGADIDDQSLAMIQPALEHLGARADLEQCPRQSELVRSHVPPE